MLANLIFAKNLKIIKFKKLNLQIIIEGIFKLQICNETVPDLETAKTELDNTFNLIFSSETTSIFFKLDFLIWSAKNFLFSLVA